MTIKESNKQIVIDLEENESLSDIQVKKREYVNNDIQIWIKINENEKHT